MRARIDCACVAFRAASSRPCALGRPRAGHQSPILVRSHARTRATDSGSSGLAVNRVGRISHAFARLGRVRRLSARANACGIRCCKDPSRDGPSRLRHAEIGRASPARAVGAGDACVAHRTLDDAGATAIDVRLCAVLDPVVTLEADGRRSPAQPAHAIQIVEAGAVPPAPPSPAHPRT